MSRKDIRGAILGAKRTFRQKEFDTEYGKLAVRELSIKEEVECDNRSKGADGEVDAIKSLVNRLIVQCIDPETGDQVFERSDFDALMGRPLSSGFMKLAVKAIGDLYREGEEEDKGPLEG